MKILIVPNKILYRQAKPVEIFGYKLQTLINKMLITMYRAKGVGLAAPQVGVLRQIVVINLKCRPIILINPRIHQIGNSLVDGVESCLSIPGYARTIERQERISVVSQNQHGKERNFEAFGFLARVIQHEVCHLRGELINNNA